MQTNKKQILIGEMQDETNLKNGNYKRRRFVGSGKSWISHQPLEEGGSRENWTIESKSLIRA
jgi:hypothetical protein